ncbi:YtxH domain-containing protein [Serinicoccus kebangsaanensis]|uniref:YtxH domain-containing protein n=1 Tax=Serinicoccus kebangsaanensis TaxID=2602069 RepID=UPI00124CE7A5|nr:YtxH domain-containing protein [Serinicoccus kebangsaanensis]
MSKIMMAAAFGAGYVLGAKAGRERYEQLSAKAQELWGHPKVQEQAYKAKEQAGRVTEQAKGRLKDAKDGDQGSMDGPWDVDTDSALAGDDLEDPRG